MWVVDFTHFKASQILWILTVKTLTDTEIDIVGGGISTENAAALTVGLMALAPASVAVITAGTVALAFYGASWMFGRPSMMPKDMKN